jgi:hypothetical protein
LPLHLDRPDFGVAGDRELDPDTRELIDDSVLSSRRCIALVPVPSPWADHGGNEITNPADQDGDLPLPDITPAARLPPNSPGSDRAGPTCANGFTPRKQSEGGQRLCLRLSGK